MKLEEKLAMQIGSLVIENAKKDSIILAQRDEIAKLTSIIKQLNDAAPPLPLGDGKAMEASNGAIAH